MKFQRKEYESLNDFIISACNMKAAQKCFSVASETAGKGTVLFVQGPSSSGKSCLMFSVASVYKEKNKTDALIVSQREFTDDYIQTIKTKNNDIFYEKYNCGLLLIDDVQDIYSHTATQNEFVSIFKNLAQNGTDIILFSEYELNRYEELQKGFSDYSSFEVVDIHKPDLIMRVKMLRNVLQKENIKLPESTLCKIVLNKKIEIASIKGIISKIKLMKSLKGAIPDKKEMNKIIKEYEN